MTHKTEELALNRRDADEINSRSQCFVCEKSMPGDGWYAQVKHGEWTVRLCCPQCAKAFYAQRLPGLRRMAFMAALQSLQWPRQQAAVLTQA